MNRPHLPFQVLGQVGPVLAWVESEDDSRLPTAWNTESVPFAQRERSWLLHELPTYSYDNVQEIVTGTRSKHRGTNPAALPFRRPPRHRLSLSPPANYDLLQAFSQLNQYFFVWNGTEPCIREGRMEALHELAVRLPAGHIVRHGHAREISEGVLGFDDALELPELVTLLPSNSFGLRSVVRQGLSESHLHLKGVISAEETWADNLLRPVSARSARGLSPAERRLLVLNRFAGGLLALAVWMSLTEADEKLDCEPQLLLSLLDQIYFARTPSEERQATTAFERAFHCAIFGAEDCGAEDCGAEDCRAEDCRTKDCRWERRLPAGHASAEDCSTRDRALINRPVPEDYRFLERWAAPTAFRLRTLRRGDTLPGSSPDGPRERYRFVCQLHLAAHLRLIQLPKSRISSGEDAAAESPSGARREGETSTPPDLRRHFLHQALFRYLVCRTHFCQSAIQQGRTTGLRYFRQSYGSGQRQLSGLSEIQYAELVLKRLRKWRGLRVLEGRVAPPRQPQDLVPWILAYTRQEDRRLRKFGLVVHFKKEDESKEEHTFSGDVPSPVPRLRWGRRRRLIRDEGLRLYRLLQRRTPVTPFVVGIDACNLELATPPEVFAPVFRFIRDLPIPSGRGGRRYSPYCDLEPAIHRLVDKRRLGMTYHVGEDFRHLLSGLRAIYEVVEFLAPQPGDRLGHGTALALHPEDWLEHNGYQAVLPKLEWLDTLVWVHHFLGPGDNLVGELAIEDLIQRRSWEIYGRAVADRYDPLNLDSPDKQGSPDERLGEERFGQQPMGGGARRRGLLDWNWSPLTLWDAWTLRQLDPYCLDLRKLLVGGELEMKPCRGFCEEDRRWHEVQKRVLPTLAQQVGSRNAYLLLAFYWMSPEVRKEGAKIISVDMQEQRTEWLELCRRVEERMKQRVHEKELVVEVNPSSNRIIGPMERYGQHHVFHLTLDDNRRLSRQVRVSINTDNPAVCNTSLAHEYYLLGEILIAEGVPEAEVVRWLEWLRSNGEEYNFVRRLKTPEEDPDMERLVTWLRGIRPTVREASTRREKLEAFWDWRRRTWLQDRGFSRQAIAADPGLLERLLALDRRRERSFRSPD